MSEAGIQELRGSSGDLGRLEDCEDSDRRTRDVVTMAIGEQIHAGKIAPVARRQSLQWSMQTKGKDTVEELE